MIKSQISLSYFSYSNPPGHPSRPLIQFHVNTINQLSARKEKEGIESRIKVFADFLLILKRCKFSCVEMKLANRQNFGSLIYKGINSYKKASKIMVKS